MNRVATTAADLIPISDRLRILRLYRWGAVALVAMLWAADPAARGVPLRLGGEVTAGYLAAGLAAEGLWRAWRDPGAFLIGLLIMMDGAFLAWVSYGTAGLRSPACYLVLLQLTTVSLIASWRTGVKLALWSSLLLLSAYYAERAGILARVGNPHIHLDASYRDVMIEVTLYWLIALATATLAAINERELRRRRYDLEALTRLALHLEAADEPSAVGDTLLAEIADAFGYDRSLLVEQRQGQLIPLASLGGEGNDWAPIEPSAAPLVTRALDENRTVLVAQADMRSDAALARVTSGSAMVVPVYAARAHGALILEHGLRHGSRVERRVVTMVERFCSHASLALGNVNLLAQIRDQAATDMLTGLANRRALDEALARSCAHAHRDEHPLSLALIDIDHFKLLNDSRGHQLGDRVLQLVGRALSHETRASDVTARYGGEEFCVLMPGSGLEAAAAATVRLCAAIALACRDLNVTASAGVACLGRHGSTPTELVAAADAALYAAKRAGRDRVVTAELADPESLAAGSLPGD